MTTDVASTATATATATGARAAVSSGDAPPFGLGIALATAATASAAGTAFADVLSGPDVMQGSARGTALVMLAVAVPVLVASMASAHRGSDRATIWWLGSTAYLLYNIVLLLFGTPFNALFLFYEATLGLAIASLIALLRRAHRAGVPARLASALRGAPVRACAAFLAFVAVANALVWLKVVVPELGSTQPAFLEGTGLTTNPIYVQDLAFWLPTALLAAWWMWQRLPVGYLLGTAYLAFWFIEGIGVAVDQYVGSSADPSSTVATMGGAYLFAAVAAITVVPLTAMLRRPRGEAR